MKTTHLDQFNRAQQQIAEAVAEFFGNRRKCWATPGTENHSANFYGDSRLCDFGRSGVIGLINMALKNWDAGEDGERRKLTTQEAIDMIISDLQLEKPE